MLNLVHSLRQNLTAIEDEVKKLFFKLVSQSSLISSSVGVRREETTEVKRFIFLWNISV